MKVTSTLLLALFVALVQTTGMVNAAGGAFSDESYDEDDSNKFHFPAKHFKRNDRGMESNRDFSNII